MLHKNFLLGCTASVLMLGCGGGGDDTVDPISKYIGTWVGSCTLDTRLVRALDELPLYVKEELTFSFVSTTTANVALTLVAYGPEDQTCANGSIGKLVWTGKSEGSEVISAAGMTSSYGENLWSHQRSLALDTGENVDLLTFRRTALSTSTSANITAGNIKFNTDDFSAVTRKSISHFPTDNQMVWNESDTDYPERLDASAQFVYEKR